MKKQTGAMLAAAVCLLVALALKSGEKGAFAVPVSAPSVVEQMASDHIAIPAVIARSAEDADLGILHARQLLPDQFGATAAGVLHEHDARDAVLVDGSIVQFADHCAGEDRERHGECSVFSVSQACYPTRVWPAGPRSLYYTMVETPSALRGW